MTALFASVYAKECDVCPRRAFNGGAVILGMLDSIFE